MSLSAERNMNNKTLVQKLLNLGFFDSHLPEVRKSLYTKRTFSKDLRHYISEKNSANLLKLLTKKSKNYIENEKKWKNNNSFNLYELNSHNEDKFNVEVIKILKSLKNFEGDLKLEKLKKDNEHFIELFDNYKAIRKKENILRNTKILHDLSLNYKSDRYFSFDINIDVLKDSPLSTTKFDELRLYYILNRERFKNKSNEKSLNTNKNNISKEPIIWDEDQMDNLKEIKYLKRINRITKNKLLKGTFLSNDSFELSNDLKNRKYQNYIKNKEERIKLKLDIENDKQEINKLKKTIEDTFGKKHKYKRFPYFNPNNLNYMKNIPLKLNSPKNADIKGQTFFVNKNELIKSPKIKDFSSTITKDSLFKSNSYNTLKDFNEFKDKNFSTYIKDSPNNIYQESTYYSNSTNNKTFLNKNNFNNLNNLKNFSRKINKNNTTKFESFNSSYSLKGNSLNQKNEKKNTTIHKLGVKYSSILEEKEKNSTVNIYSICKNMENKKFSRNRMEYLEKINKYIKSKKFKYLSINKENKIKNTFTFFHNIKDKIKNEQVKINFRNLNKEQKDEFKQKLKYIDILDSNLVKKENELLINILKKN